MRHVAYCLTTGEVIICTRACALKRRVARNTHWDVTHGYRGHEWVFAHGRDAEKKIAEKHFKA